MLSDEQIVDCYAPPLAPDDERPELAARAIEETWPEVRLICEVVERPYGPYQRVLHEHDRAAYLRGGLAQGRIPFITNPDDQRTVTLSGWLEGGVVAPGGVPQLRVHSELPAEPVFLERAGDALERLARALRATWGAATPQAAHAVIMEQVMSADSSDEPPRGLPRLTVGYELAGDDVPHWLGWVNYWSARATARVGFPDPARDAEWLARARRVGDGWLVRLTDEPLDLDRDDHFSVLERAYARFTAVGRVTR